MASPNAAGLKRFTRHAQALTLTVAAIVSTVAVGAQDAGGSTGWPACGGWPPQIRYSSLAQIESPRRSTSRGPDVASCAIQNGRLL